MARLSYGTAEPDFRERSSEETSELTEELKSECCEVFFLFDAESTGNITPTDAAAAVRLLGFNPTNAKLKESVSKHVVAESNTVPLPAFLRLIEEYAKADVNPDELRDAFESFDIGSNGYVLVSDLKRAVTELGEKLSDKEMAEFLDSAGLTLEDNITFQDIQKLFGPDQKGDILSHIK